MIANGDAGGAELATGVAVIGSGPAGLALAMRLAEAGVDVMVLESGGRTFDPGTQSLNQATSDTEVPVHPETSRFRLLGGSTAYWSGRCLAFDTLDFERRDEIPYSGWPFTIEKLDKSYDLARELLGLNFSGSDLDAVESELRRDTSSWRTDELDVRYVDRQWKGFSDLHTDTIAGHPHLTVWLNSTALRFATDAAGTTVTRVICSDRAGRRFSVSAQVFVAAAGGIENPRLLLMSNEHHSAGLGNHHGLVGRFFMDHPYADAGSVLAPAMAHLLTGAEQRSEPHQHHGLLVLSEAVRRSRGLPGAAVYLKRVPAYLASAANHSEGVRAVRAIGVAGRYGQPRRLGEHLPRLVSGIGDIARHTALRLAHQARPRRTHIARVVIEPVPNPDNRVVLSTESDELGQPRAHIEWRLSETDRQTYRELTRALERAAAAAGGAFEPSRVIQQHWPAGLQEGKHHMGTTRMHASERKGVVDANLRVHGTSNLYMAGSSVFPTAGYANPTLTIAALSIRLADHLQNVVGGR